MVEYLAQAERNAPATVIHNPEMRKVAQEPTAIQQCNDEEDADARQQALPGRFTLKQAIYEHANGKQHGEEEKDLLGQYEQRHCEAEADPVTDVRGSTQREKQTEDCDRGEEHGEIV